MLLASFIKLTIKN